MQGIGVSKLLFFKVLSAPEPDCCFRSVAVAVAERDLGHPSRCRQGRWLHLVLNEWDDFGVKLRGWDGAVLACKSILASNDIVFVCCESVVSWLRALMHSGTATSLLLLLLLIPQILHRRTAELLLLRLRGPVLVLAARVDPKKD